MTKMLVLGGIWTANLSISRERSISFEVYVRLDIGRIEVM